MPVYFASDVHLRLDRPERARRLARWVDGSGAGRRAVPRRRPLRLLVRLPRSAGPTRWPATGLRALADFRARGGSLDDPGRATTTSGSARSTSGPSGATARRRAADGRGLRPAAPPGPRPPRRGPRALEGVDGEPGLPRAPSRACPAPVAARLDRLLEARNDRDRAARRGAARRDLPPVPRRGSTRRPTSSSSATSTRPLDDPRPRPRLVVLGGWHAPDELPQGRRAGARRSSSSPRPPDARPGPARGRPARARP